MTIVIYGTMNILSELGERYFHSKYGFPAQKIKEHIVLREIGKANLGEKENHGVLSRINYQNYTLPAFDLPQSVDEEGRILATAEKNGESFPCIVDNGKEIIIGFDIFFYIGFSLSGQLDTIWKRMGNGKETFIRLPFVDIYTEILFKSVCRIYNRKGLSLIYKSFWPDGKTFAVCLTHDVDEIKKTYQWITYPLRMIRNNDFNGLKNQCRSFKQKLGGIEPFWTFPSLMAMEKELNVRSSFYFLNEKGKVEITDPSTWRHLGRRYSPRKPEVAALIKKMHAEGWDVGLHGSFYSFTNPKLLKIEKNELEDVLGSRIVGTRQHNLNLKVPDTWTIQSEAGLVYDSTLGFNDTIGFRWGACFPFDLYDHQKNRFINLLEIPLIIEEIALFRKENYKEQAIRIENQVEQMHGVLTLLWHHSVMNNYEFPGWGASYEQIIRRCLEKNAWITHGAAITEWWRKREKLPLYWDYHDNILNIRSKSYESGYFQCLLPQGKKVKKIENATIIGTSKNGITIKPNMEKMDDIHIILEG